ncbi:MULTISPECIES: Hsp70 family protein [unclassified Arthrobacter]|uniref:Hsp70 family protein n=1 Tax=unclassified Arthrobacter TaxID=235627 RepID=UPI0033930C2D
MKLADGQLRFAEVPMSYVLAVDVGTSFTAAAIARDDQPVPESLPLGLRGTAVPSVVYYPEEGPILVGEAAERRGLDVPARVVREFKRRIGDSVPIAVGTLALPAEEIFATMARWVADRAEEREGAPPSEIIISHPAAWGGHRTTAVLAALAAKGMPSVTLISEPEAAALHYASQVRVEDGSTIAVYDLGGGTFDTAILRKDGNGRFEFLGTPEGIEGLGGADFDAAVLRYVAAHTGEALAALDPEDPAALAALARLKRECVEAKEALSADSEASISVFLPGVQQQVRLVRSEFEDMVEEPLRETVEALERSLEQLGLEPADLSAVLLIGGSSRIPLVAQLISEQLDRPIAVDADPKSSICLGAAVAALQASPAVAAGPAGAADAIPEIPAPADVVVEPHGADRRASWSRKSGAAFGSLAGTAATGDGARGAPLGDAHHAHVAKGGTHARRPVIRLTAVAAGAALFTILTATAAGSPDGLGSLSAMFAPEAPAAAGEPGGSGAPAGSGAAAGSAGGAQDPVIGIEASAKDPEAPADSAGIDAAASPTSRPSASAPPSTGSTPGNADAGSTPGGPRATSVPTQAAAQGTPAGTPTMDPAAPPSTTSGPLATTSPTTTPARATEPPATTPPSSQPPVTTPPVTTGPTATTPPTTTAPPVTTPQPSLEPAPTTPVPPATSADPTSEPPTPAPTSLPAA